MTQRLTWQERWYAKVTPGEPDDCWLFKGAGRAGYGQFWDGLSTSHPRTVAAHRWAYEKFVGPIPDGMDILHSCDTPLCVNHRHLRPGTHAENMADAVARERFTGANAGGRHLHSRKMTWDLVRDMRARSTGERGEAQIFAREYGLDPSTVHYILKGQRWAET